MRALPSALIVSLGLTFAQQAAAQLPWGHIMVLLDKKLEPRLTDAYAAAAVEYG